MTMKKFLALLLSLMLLASSVAVADVATDTDLDDQTPGVTEPETSGEEPETPEEEPGTPEEEPETSAEEPETPAGEEPEEDAPVLADYEYYYTRAIQNAQVSIEMTLNGEKVTGDIDVAALTDADDLVVTATATITEAQMLESADLSNLVLEIWITDYASYQITPGSVAVAEDGTFTFSGSVTLPHSGLHFWGYEPFAYLREKVMGTVSESQEYLGLEVRDTGALVLDEDLVWVNGNAVELMLPDRGGDMELLVTLEDSDEPIDWWTRVGFGDEPTFSSGVWVYMELEPGTYEISARFQGAENDWSAPVTVTIKDVYAAPVIEMTQTGLYTATVTIRSNSSAVNYSAAYNEDEWKDDTVKGTKQKDGTYVTTLSFTNVSPMYGLNITAWAMVPKNKTSYVWGNSSDAYLNMVNFWGWATAPKVTVAQDMEQDSVLRVNVTPSSATEVVMLGDGWYDLHYLVDVGGIATSELSFGSYSELVGTTWNADLEWHAGWGTKKTVVTVTPVLEDTYDGVCYYGTPARVTWNATTFVEDQWKKAPSIKLVDTGLGYATLEVTLYGNVMTQAEGEPYPGFQIWVGGLQVTRLLPVTELGTNHCRFSLYIEEGNKDDGSTGVLRTSLIQLGKKTTVKVVPYRATRDDEGWSMVYGNAASASITLSSTPAWAKSAFKLTAAQVDDYTVSLTFPTPVGASELYYKIQDNNTLLEEDEYTVATVGKNTVVTLNSVADGKSHTYKLTPWGYDLNGSSVSGKTAKVTIKKLTAQWATKPTVKATVDSTTSLSVAVKVTYKGSPADVLLQLSADGKKGWETVASLSEEQLQEGWSVTAIGSRTVTFAYSSVTAPGTFYLRAVNVNGDGVQGNAADAVKVTMLPQWASTNLKPTATQIGEHDVKVSVKAVSISNTELHNLGIAAGWTNLYNEEISVLYFVGLYDAADD